MNETLYPIFFTDPYYLIWNAELYKESEPETITIYENITVYENITIYETLSFIKYLKTIFGPFLSSISMIPNHPYISLLIYFTMFIGLTTGLIILLKKKGIPFKKKSS